MPGSAGVTPADLLALARQVAAEGGELVRRLRTEGVDVAETKSSPTDVVTRADRACEELLRERLLGARPEDGFFGEEGDDVVGTSGVRWVVDPIDGTVNYLYGFPEYAVSVAAELDGRVVAGVVLSPEGVTEHTAALGEGAFLDGSPLRLGEPGPLSGALVGTGFGYRAELRERQGRAVAALLPQVRDVRRRGSAALDLCAVASGRLDAYVEEGPHLWDHAAAGLVAQEAGARVEIWPGDRGSDLVVAAPEGAFEAFADLVRSCGFGEGGGPAS